MKTTQQLAKQNIIDLVTVLMCGPKQFDMSTVEHCVAIEMQETGLEFSKEVLADTYNMVSEKFDTPEEYFFDAINAMNINEDKIYNLVELCIA